MCIWQHGGINNQFYSIPRKLFCRVYLFNLRSYNAVVFKSYISNKIFITFGSSKRQYKIIKFVKMCCTYSFAKKKHCYGQEIFTEKIVSTQERFFQ